MVQREKIRKKIFDETDRKGHGFQKAVVVRISIQSRLQVSCDHIHASSHDKPWTDASEVSSINSDENFDPKHWVPLGYDLARKHKSLQESNEEYYSAAAERFAGALCENAWTLNARKIAILRPNSPDSFLSSTSFLECCEEKKKTCRTSQKLRRLYTSCRWTETEEDTFITSYNKWCVSPSGPGNHWDSVIQEMESHGVYKTRQQCRDKIKQLLSSNYAIRTKFGKIIPVVKKEHRPHR